MARPEQDGTRERKRRDVQEFEVTSEQPRTEVALKANNKNPTFKKADNWNDTGEEQLKRIQEGLIKMCDANITLRHQLGAITAIVV